MPWEGASRCKWGARARRRGRQPRGSVASGRGGTASKDLPALGWAGAAEPPAARSQPPVGAAAAPSPGPEVPAGGPRGRPPSRRSDRRGDGGERRRGGVVVVVLERGGGIHTGLTAANSRRLRPHRRGVGAGSRGDPEGPARFPRDGAPTGPGEQEWLGPSPVPGSFLLPTVPAPPSPAQVILTLGGRAPAPPL